MSMIQPHTAAEWRDALKAYLPRGAAWQVPHSGAFEGLLWGLAEEFSRAEARLVGLVEEADPMTTTELIGAWESTFGLPDRCFGTPADIEARRLAVTQRMTSQGGQSILYFKQLANSIGYSIEIVEFRPARIGDTIGQLLFSSEWRFAWGVKVLVAGPAELDLECLIRRHKPAHTQVFFTYEED